MNNRILRTEIRDEFLAILRDPAALFFSIVMPVGFFALTVGIFVGGDGDGLSLLANYGAFAVIAVVVLNPGIGLAQSRESGWLRVKRASGTPLSLTLVAKVIAAIPYAVVVMAAMIVAASAFGALDGDIVRLAVLVTVLVIGSLPFALLGLAVGSKVSVNGTSAVLNAILFPMVIASGLWFPLEILPEMIQRVAPFMPAYHLAQLADATVTSGPWIGHVGALALTAVIGAGLASWAYRSART